MEDPPKVTLAWWREAHSLRTEEYLHQPSTKRMDQGHTQTYICKWHWGYAHSRRMNTPRMGRDNYQPLPAHIQVGLGSLGLYEGRGIWRMGQEVEVDTPESRRDTRYVMVARGIEILPDYKRDHRTPTFKPAKSDLSTLRRCSWLTRTTQIERCMLQDSGRSSTTRSIVWKLDRGHPTLIPTSPKIGNGDVWSGTAVDNLLRTKGGGSANWKRGTTSRRVGT